MPADIERLAEYAQGGVASLHRIRWRGDARKGTWLVKELLPHLQEVPRLRRQLLREARLGMQLRSLYFAEVVAAWSHPHPGFVQAHRDGCSIRSLQHTLKPAATAQHRATLASWLIQESVLALKHLRSVRDASGRALATAHGDFSPANVLLGGDGQLVLVDLAEAVLSAEHTEVDDRHVGQALAYAAPERLTEGSPPSLAADAFSIGVIAWELAAGRRLFARATPQATLCAVAEHRAAPHLRDIPQALNATLQHLLAPEPEQRLEVMDALAEAKPETKATELQTVLHALTTR